MPNRAAAAENFLAAAFTPRERDGMSCFAIQFPARSRNHGASSPCSWPEARSRARALAIRSPEAGMAGSAQLESIAGLVIGNEKPQSGRISSRPGRHDDLVMEFRCRQAAHFFYASGHSGFFPLVHCTPDPGTLRLRGIVEGQARRDATSALPFRGRTPSSDTV